MQSIEAFVNDLFDTMKTVSTSDLDKAARLLADNGATGRDRWIQLVRCAAIIGNHARCLPVPAAPPAFPAPLDPYGQPLDLGTMHVRVLRRPNDKAFYLEHWNGHFWHRVFVDGVQTWSQGSQLIAAAQAVAASTNRELHWHQYIVREHVASEPTPVPISIGGLASTPPALAGETTETVRDICDGAFRTVPSKNGFAIQRWRTAAEHGFDHWSGLMEECGEPLYPWREHPTVDAAEAAILEYGRLANAQTTLIRNDGHEIVTAAPGSTAFPRQVETVQHAETVTLFPGELPKPGTFRIRPTIAGDAWVIWQWCAAGPLGQVGKSGAVGEWKSWPALAKSYPTYWAAADAVHQHAREHAEIMYGEKTYLVAFTAEDCERWRERGIEVGAPPMPAISVKLNDQVSGPITTAHDQAAQLAAAYAPPTVEAVDDTVMITGSADEVAAIGAEVVDALVEETRGVFAPVIPIGTKIPVPVGDDLWKVDEYTADGWITIRDEMTWDEVGAFLNPPSPSTGDPVGKIEIVPSPDQPGTFNVQQWTGTKWKVIGGNLSQRTAEGVVKARMNDPENKIAEDVTHKPHKAMALARVRIKALINSIEMRSEDQTVTDQWIIDRLQDFLEILKPIN